MRRAVLAALLTALAAYAHGAWQGDSRYLVVEQVDQAGQAGLNEVATLYDPEDPTFQITISQTEELSSKLLALILGRPGTRWETDLSGNVLVGLREGQIPACAWLREAGVPDGITVGDQVIRVSLEGLPTYLIHVYQHGVAELADMATDALAGGYPLEPCLEADGDLQQLRY